MFKTFYFIMGTISLSFGFIGVFLPVLPTTPFILLSLFFYGKGHPDKVNQVLNHPKLKLYIQDYISKEGIPLISKLKALFLLWSSIIISLVFFISSIYIRIIVLISSSCVTLYILSRRTKK